MEEARFKCATLNSGQKALMEKLLESINTTCEGSATHENLEYEAGKEPAATPEKRGKKPATPTSKNKGKGIHACLSCPNLPTLISLISGCWWPHVSIPNYGLLSMYQPCSQT